MSTHHVPQLRHTTSNHIELIREKSQGLLGKRHFLKKSQDALSYHKASGDQMVINVCLPSHDT